MPDQHGEFQNYMAIQRDVFRIAKRDYALSAKRLHVLTKLPEPTIRTWANGTAMPAWAFSILCRYIPDELTSMLMEPSAKHIGTDAPDDGDLDELATEAAAFSGEYVNARHPRSPGGVAIVPIESAPLKERARRIAATARRAAA